MSLFCHRCTCPLTPGAGDFYLVTIDAVADPTPPAVTAEALAADSRETMQQLIDELQCYSERELMDMVHRRVVIHLCRPCYVIWIENPAK